MNNLPKLHLIVLSILIIPVSLLLSYNLTLLTTPLTSSQQAVFDYLLDDQPISSPYRYYNSNSYNEREISHLQDVKKVMRLTSASTIIIIITLFVYLYYLYRRAGSSLLPLLAQASLYSIIFSLVFISLTIISFPTLFTNFHYLFFPQGNWQFPADSILIKTFPESFFQTIAIQITATAILLQLLAPITNYLINRYKRNSKQKPQTIH